LKKISETREAVLALGRWGESNMAKMFYDPGSIPRQLLLAATRQGEDVS
jgi:hypothetical protein